MGKGRENGEGREKIGKGERKWGKGRKYIEGRDGRLQRTGG